MRPRDVRSRILEDHAALRGDLEALGALVQRVAEGEVRALSELRERGLALHHRLAEHLDMEDRLLLPAIRASGPEGPGHAERLVREHAEQRALLEYVLSRIEDATRPAPVLAEDLGSLVELMLQDMAWEEHAILGGILLAAEPG